MKEIKSKGCKSEMTKEGQCLCCGADGKEIQNPPINEEECPYCLTDLTTTEGKHLCKECQSDVLTMTADECLEGNGLCENCRELKRD